jgi:LacI family transcriptional regulator
MPKKTSMDDLAKKLGISKNTVSLALRDMPGVNIQTKQLIIETAKTMGYQYKKTSEVSKNICLIMSGGTRNSTAGFFNYVQYGIENEAKNESLNIIINYYDENSDNFELPLCIKDNIISGIITLGRISRKIIDILLSLNLPVIMVDHYFDNLNLTYILSDNISSGYIATEYLIKKEIFKIGFIGNVNASVSFRDRYWGYINALQAYNLPLIQDFIFIKNSMEELSRIDIQLVVAEFKKRKELPSAFFCCNDAEAITVIKALNSLNLRIPQDISIIGFDDIDFSQNISPALTTMRVQKETMGKKAVEKLVNLINNPNTLCEKLLLSTELIKRDSVK